MFPLPFPSSFDLFSLDLFNNIVAEETSTPHLLIPVAIEGSMLLAPGGSRFTKLRQEQVHYKTLTRLGVRNSAGNETKFSCKTKKWYCGQPYVEAGKCKCSNCDGVCGPTNGCPCDSCAEIVLKYCGKEFCARGQCYCGTCDGVCGPTNGCPCPDCVVSSNLFAAISRFDQNRTALYPTNDVFTTILLATSKHSLARCPQGHQTFALKRTPPAYSSANKVPQCDDCCEMITGRFAHCALCNYDLCRKCEIAKVGALIVPRITCSAKHPLATLFEKPDGYIGNTKCNACLTLIDYDDGFFHCKRCSYDLCQQCEGTIFTQLRAPWPDRLRCPCGQHIGNVAFTARDYSMSNNMMCCQCEDAIRLNEGFMFADCCSADQICFNCARQFVRKNLSDCKLTCPANHALKAFCSSKPSVNLCDSCDESVVYKNGYLRCDPCDYDLCSKCAFEITDTKNSGIAKETGTNSQEHPTREESADGLGRTCAKPEQLRREYESLLEAAAAEQDASLTATQDLASPTAAAAAAAAATSSDVSTSVAAVPSYSVDGESVDETSTVAQTVRQATRPTLRQVQPCGVDSEEGSMSPDGRSRDTTDTQLVPLIVRVVYESEEIVVSAREVSNLESLRQIVSEMISKVEETPVHPDSILLDVIENGECSPLHLPRRFTEAFKTLDQNNPVLRVIATLENCPIQEWDLLEPLGKGTFGKVFKAMNRDGFTFAAKEIELSQTNNEEPRSELLALQAEIRLVRQLKHPNLIEYYGSCEAGGNKFYILMEYVASGSLAKLISTHKLSLSQVQSFTRQLLSGLEYLHRFSVVHRDVKPDNIMISHNGTLKIVDFGTAKHLSATTASSTDSRGTPLYMAPEIISAQGCRTSCDIWSVGCTVVEMITQTRPFSELGKLNQIQLFYKIAVEKKAPQWPTGLSPLLNDFLEQCFRANPKDRPSATELLAHPFLVEKL